MQKMAVINLSPSLPSLINSRKITRSTRFVVNTLRISRSSNHHHSLSLQTPCKLPHPADLPLIRPHSGLPARRFDTRAKAAPESAGEREKKQLVAILPLVVAYAKLYLSVLFSPGKTLTNTIEAVQPFFSDMVIGVLIALRLFRAVSRNVLSKKVMVKEEESLDSIALLSKIRRMSILLILAKAIILPDLSFTPLAIEIPELNVGPCLANCFLVAFCFNVCDSIRLMILEKLFPTISFVGNYVKCAVVILSSFLLLEAPVSANYVIISIGIALICLKKLYSMYSSS